VSKNGQWRRLAAEFVLIVVGVVAALGVDRWVQGIDEDRTERDYLVRLTSDVEVNIEIFDGMLQDWDASQKAAADLMGLLADPSPRSSSAGLLAAIARAAATNTGPARDSNFQDLAATGNLKLIRDSELRSGVVNYFGFEIRAGRPAMDRLDLRFRSFALEYLPVEWVTDWRRLRPRATPAFECSVDGVPSTDTLWLAFTQNPEMLRLLNARHNDAARGRANIQRWLNASKDVLALLRASLDPV